MNAQQARDEHLLAAWGENEALKEEINRLQTALEVACRDNDHYRAEIAMLEVANDTLTAQNTEYRVHLDVAAKELEDELETLGARRNKLAVKFRNLIRGAEMKPYTDAPRPLVARPGFQQLTAEQAN